MGSRSNDVPTCRHGYVKSAPFECPLCANENATPDVADAELTTGSRSEEGA